VDTFEDGVDKAVERQWPGLIQLIHVDLSSDIGEDDFPLSPHCGTRQESGEPGLEADVGNAGPRLELEREDLRMQ
jgi:hypothetical protein